jgi:hypothetical protein
MAYVVFSIDTTDTKARFFNTKGFMEKNEAIAYVKHAEQASTDSSADFPGSDQAGKLVEDIICVCIGRKLNLIIPASLHQLVLVL